MNTGHIPYELVLKIETALKQKKHLEKLAGNYTYREQLNFEGNLQILGNQLAQLFQMQPASSQSLHRFMVDKNLPIEFTLRPLRLSHLVDFLSEWLNHSSLDSSYHRNTIVVSYRNLIFKTVFHEEKQTIDDYFSTLSQKNMLISDDLFNLLQNILSTYFLYEYYNDKQSFFDKQNAILSFKQVVSKYANSNHRISSHSQLQNPLYIRRWQLQNLVQFWQGINQELTLCASIRRAVRDTHIQTDLNHTSDVPVQTQMENVTLISIINSTLIKLNSLTQTTQHQEAVQRICQLLRAEKIAFLREKEKQRGNYLEPPKTQKYKLTASKNFFQEAPKTPLSICGKTRPKYYEKDTKYTNPLECQQKTKESVKAHQGENFSPKPMIVQTGPLWSSR